MLVERYDIDRVAVLVLNNPPANGYSHAMHKELDAHVVDIRMDDGIDVIVIRGEGDAVFCAGADMHYLRGLTAEQKYSFCLHANETLLRLEHTPKLVIAALNGHCVGGGLEIALACDLRVGRTGTAKPDKVGLPEVALGVLPGTGGTQRLARVMGRAQALRFMVEGRNVSVDEAVALGIVHTALPAEGWWAQVLDYARSFCRPQKSSAAVGLIKRAVLGGADLPLESALGLERELQQRLFTGPDAREGFAAFLEKRPPSFAPSDSTAALASPAAAPAASPAAAPAKDPSPAASPAASPAKAEPAAAPAKDPSAAASPAAAPAKDPSAAASPAAAPGPRMPLTRASTLPAVNEFAGDDLTNPGVRAAKPPRGPTAEGYFEGAFDSPTGRSPRVTAGGAESVQRALNHVKDAVLNRVPRGLVEEHLLIPLRIEGGVLILAMADPGDRAGIAAVEAHTGLKVRVEASNDLDITAAITRYYRA